MISYQKHWLELIFFDSQQQRIVSLSKNMAVLERIIVYVSYYSEVLSEYAKKSGVWRKVKFGMSDH